MSNPIGRYIGAVSGGHMFRYSVVRYSTVPVGQWTTANDPAYSLQLGLHGPIVRTVSGLTYAEMDALESAFLGAQRAYDLFLCHEWTKPNGVRVSA